MILLSNKQSLFSRLVEQTGIECASELIELANQVCYHIFMFKYSIHFLFSTLIIILFFQLNKGYHEKKCNGFDKSNS